METPNNIFRYNVMEFEPADSLITNSHDHQIEISLINTTGIPVVDANNRCVMTKKYLDFAERIHNFTVHPDDVWIITFPKSGTTWTQEMVWLIDHDLDYTTARAQGLLQRSVFLEMSAVVKQIKEDSVESAEKLKRPRHIKSHLPLAMLPKQLWTVKPKMVYCTRNPFDVAVSYMHHYRHLHGYSGPKDTFLKGLMADKVLWCPQVQHTLDFWNYKKHISHYGLREADDCNFMFVHYEEMIKDLMKVIKRTCAFLGKKYTDQQLKVLAKHLSFDEMKANPSTNHAELLTILNKIHGKEETDFQFMRKGQVGTYKTELKADFMHKFEPHINQQLEGTDFRYKIDI